MIVLSGEVRDGGGGAPRCAMDAGEPVGGYVTG